MKLRYLGTGAGAGIPHGDCDCAVCTDARAQDGRYVRKRCSMLINNDLIVDLPPGFGDAPLGDPDARDTVAHVLVTHNQADHFCPDELPRLRQRTVAIYGGAEVRKAFHSAQEENMLSQRYHFVTAKCFEPFEAGSYIITPLKARHGAGALIYLIEQEGRVLLYGNDTGYFPEDTWDYLGSRKIHAVSLDCTYPLNIETKEHMDIEDCITIKRRMFQQGNLTAKTRFLATHFSHKGGLGHYEIDERLRLYGIDASYDGLSFELQG